MTLGLRDADECVYVIESECKRNNETRFEKGPVSKCIKANYLNWQAGLFKLVSFYAAYTAENETRSLNKPPDYRCENSSGINKTYEMAKNYFLYYTHIILLLLDTIHIITNHSL